MGLSLSDGELISWLVENHLLMSSISQKKDIYDGEIINHFVELVENTEKLDYLYLLTINDIIIGLKTILSYKSYFNADCSLSKDYNILNCLFLSIAHLNLIIYNINSNFI